MELEKNLTEYVQFIVQEVDKYKKATVLVDQDADEVTPKTINTALSNYGTINLMLIAEYNRKKAELRQVEMDYEEWYDKKFSAIRQEMTSKVESKSIKISVKEIETEVRVQNTQEYKEWQAKIFKAEQQVSFFRRMLEMWKKMDSILINISYNMRSEMKSLSLDDRMNSQKALMGSMGYREEESWEEPQTPSRRKPAQ